LLVEFEEFVSNGFPLFASDLSAAGLSLQTTDNVPEELTDTDVIFWLLGQVAVPGVKPLDDLLGILKES
jgi:hypothetical protein